jgi:hypothetical protein
MQSLFVRHNNKNALYNSNFTQYAVSIVGLTWRPLAVNSFELERLISLSCESQLSHKYSRVLSLAFTQPYDRSIFFHKLASLATLFHNLQTFKALK